MNTKNSFTENDSKNPFAESDDNEEVESKVFGSEESDVEQDESDFGHDVSDDDDQIEDEFQSHSKNRKRKLTDSESSDNEAGTETPSDKNEPGPSQMKQRTMDS